MFFGVLLHGGEHHEGGILTEAIMVKSHAAFMVLGWLVLLNIGSVFGRYLKAPPNKAYRWYPYHLVTQVIGLACSVIGFFIIVVHLIASEEGHFEGLHQILGLLLSLLLIPQPILGYLAHQAFLNTGKSSKYHIWHRWLGRAVNVLALITMGMGIKLFYGNIETNVDVDARNYVWLCFLVCIFVTFAAYLIFEIYSNPNENSSNDNKINNLIVVSDDSDSNIVFSPLDNLASVNDSPAPSFSLKSWKIWFNQIVFISFCFLLLSFSIPLIYTLLL